MSRQISATVVKRQSTVVTPTAKLFPCSQIIITRENVPSLGANASITHENAKSFVQESIETLVAASGGELFLATVYYIDNQYFPGGISYAFPSAFTEAIKPFTNPNTPAVNSCIVYLHVYYYVGETVAALTTNSNATTTFLVSGANVVSPTAPNRTITVVLNGVTYYLAAKTTND